jgi:hypothetical protein
MKSDWVSTVLPARTGVWQVTRTEEGERIVGEGVYLHPDDPPSIKSMGIWLDPGWYSLIKYERMPDVVAWMPLPCPFDGQASAYPVKVRPARPGDIVTGAQVLGGRKILLNMELEGGEPMDVLQLDSVRMAIDTLAEVMCPTCISLSDEVEIRLLVERSLVQSGKAGPRARSLSRQAPSRGRARSSSRQAAVGLRSLTG